VQHKWNPHLIIGFKRQRVDEADDGTDLVGLHVQGLEAEVGNAQVQESSLADEGDDVILRLSALVDLYFHLKRNILS
jgi:hypothetical protein